jgi:hypothetical protein
MALKCEEVRDRFSALWENGLDPVEEVEVRGHLDLCSECQKEFARFDKTLHMLHSVREVEVPEGFLPGIYEKMEKRKPQSLSHEKARRGWLILSHPWRLPAQALAMVAIVFLALYLTQMMPDESLRMKRLDEAKLKPSQPTDQVVANRALVKKEDKQETLQTPKDKARTATGEKGSILTQADALRGSASTEAPASSKPSPAQQMEEKKTASPSAGKRMEEREVMNRSNEKIGDEGAGGRPLADAPQEAPHPQKAEAPQLPLLKAKKGVGMGATGDVNSLGLKPSEEIVLKSDDPKKRVSQIQELVKQFKGEILNLEGNNLFVSLPDTSLQEFKKQLEGVRPSAQKQALPSREGRVGPVAEGGSKRRETGEKDKETLKSDDGKEVRIIVRIILIEE